MRRHLTLLLVSALALLAFAASAEAKAKPNPTLWKTCRHAHTCPSSNHGYAWHGQVCAVAAKRIKTDKKRVTFRGNVFYCHSKPKPKAPSVTTTTTDPVAAFTPGIRAFFAALVPKIQEIAQNLPGQPNADHALLQDGLTALGDCATTLSVDAGVVPDDTTVQTAMGQLNEMCQHFATAASDTQSGLSDGDVSAIAASLDEIKQAAELGNAAAALLGLSNPFGSL